MTITGIAVYPVRPRWILVRVDTERSSGWGEAIVPKRVASVRAAVGELGRVLHGADENRIEEIATRCRQGAFFRGGPVLSTAAAAIEQALWDIKARRFGVPVWELLGGRVRDRVRVYAWIGGDRPGEVVEAARLRLEQGFSVVKMNATAEFDQIETTAAADEVIARVAALREAFGTRLDLALDFHGRVHRPMLRPLLRELEPYRLLWVEEPLAPGHDSLLGDLRAATRIATGERLCSRWEFRELLHGGAVDILQPDVSLTGLFELEKICRMAECYDVPVIPHCPNGPVSLAASLQVAGCCAGIPMLEQSLGLHYNTGYAGAGSAEPQDYLRDPGPLRPVDGYLPVPEGPGLGIELDPGALERGHTEHVIPDPQWRLPDGRLTEW
ncbi:galactonate dehydratase [Sciscionella marina]|uniref:galactonate dehydratase n=1 Tax=Sciscionella marina TaxID=508770 RepID=UPI00035FFB9E|nr:galactonate dehydratase [Sciscionella marina]